DKVRDVGKGVFKLTLGQGSMTPIGKARCVVDALTGDAGDLLVIGDAVAETAHRRRNLCFKYRRGNQTAQMIDDIDILTRSMENLGHLLIAHEIEEGPEVHARRQRVYQSGDARSRELNQTELRPEGGLADELGIDRDEIRS